MTIVTLITLWYVVGLICAAHCHVLVYYVENSPICPILKREVRFLLVVSLLGPLVGIGVVVTSIVALCTFIGRWLDLDDSRDVFWDPCQTWRNLKEKYFVRQHDAEVTEAD